ncbi:aspartyl-phosphate phosphatase Spo0E family protein [Ornithinibacillus contaminans]|uniref:aspartyl-phosphate phosphatase Spo0E family protein n=1 Tax=Ornithinibacillus contaminans TaxID=694055 RepID=UPI00138F8DB7|nr:aspartyl-phosphate phosphatase Spo0E family protein [Ornithinibacillus contaminans]
MMKMYRHRNNLVKKINQVREKMFHYAKQYGMDSQKTLSASMELDELIMEYMREFRGGK